TLVQTMWPSDLRSQPPTPRLSPIRDHNDTTGKKRTGKTSQNTFKNILRYTTTDGSFSWRTHITTKTLTLQLNYCGTLYWQHATSMSLKFACPQGPKCGGTTTSMRNARR